MQPAIGGLLKQWIVITLHEAEINRLHKFFNPCSKNIDNWYYQRSSCPVDEQKFIADNLPNSTFLEIDSSYGHDGFLIESQKISHLLAGWLHAII
jgi:hypothetical protein